LSLKRGLFLQFRRQTTVTVRNINGREQARGPSGLGFAKANNSSPLKSSIL